MNILGIVFSTNSTAALLRSGSIVACASEERFSRKKNTQLYPKNAVEYCLKSQGLTVKDLDIIALAGHKANLNYYLVDRDSNFSVFDSVREQKEYWYPKLYKNQYVSYLDIFSHKINKNNFPANYNPKIRGDSYAKGRWRHEFIVSHLGEEARRKIKEFHHHLTHNYYGVYSGADPRKKHLVFCLEGFGDDANASVSIYDKGTFTTLYKTDQCYLGRLYRYMTLLLGMKPNEHEFKVMGLAPYSKPYHSDRPFKIFSQTMFVDENGEFQYKIRPPDTYFYFKEMLDGCRFDGIAQGLQRYTERIIIDFVKTWVRKTGVRSLVFSGGVCMNIKALMHVAQLEEIDQLWVGPSVSDESLAIGACFYAYSLNADPSKIEVLKHVYLGNEYSDEQIEKSIEQNNLKNKYTLRPNQSARDIAQLLSKGLIIGRVAGSMEFGARALGNRSILADPRSSSMVRIINEKIKKRDFWMPFAPAILKERVDDYFVNPKKIKSPYMALAFESTELARKELPAALHPSDFTLRPQVVEKDKNSRFYEIIKEFEKITGIGALLNTSFNLHGSPIVRTPQDALDVFEKTGIDALLLNNHLIIK